MTSHQNSTIERTCICDHPHADHQQTPDGASECDLCDCPT